MLNNINLEDCDYAGLWRPYVYHSTKNGFIRKKDLCAKLTKVKLDGTKGSASGVPVVVDLEQRQAWVNEAVEHTLIIGSSGTKKTRNVLVPMLANSIHANNSAIVVDIKGELSTQGMAAPIRSLLKQHGYREIYLDLRNFSADHYNILEPAFRLWRTKKYTEASAELNKLAAMMSNKYKDSKADPYWQDTARQWFVCLMELLFATCDDPRYINFTSLATFVSKKDLCALNEVVEYLPKVPGLKTMLRSASGMSRVTLNCTLSTLNSMLEVFTNNLGLSSMLSGASTFRVEELIEKPTILYIIVPDETNSMDAIVGHILGQILSTLMQQAYNLGGKFERILDVFVDEVCQYPVPNLGRCLAAHRARNVRWTLVVQSLAQLRSAYADADTIISNAANWVFLGSHDIGTLRELSEISGTISFDEYTRPLLSVETLQNLKLGWDEREVFYKHNNDKYVTRLPDITQYDWWYPSKVETYTLPHPKTEPIRVCNVEAILNFIRNNASDWSARRTAQQALEKYQNNEFDD